MHYIFWECVFSLSYPACKPLAPYCHLCPAQLYHVFPHYHINSKIFEKKNCWTQNVYFDFLYDLFSNISHSKKKWARYGQKYQVVFCKVPFFSCLILMKLEFSRWFVFLKILKYQISWKSVGWEPSCSMRTDGRTDKHDEANNIFSKFCELP